MPADELHHRAILRALRRAYPDVRCGLDYETPLQLLVAAMLSAQCPDRRVNLVTPALFRRYPTAHDFAGADRAELEGLIERTGFFRSKAANIIAMAQRLCEAYGGEVPATLDELVTLQGVGRKTANVILQNIHDVPGLTVDTHFGRLARRFGWTEATDPVKVERDIAALFPPRDWNVLSHVLVWHGRLRCHARKPACGACPIARWCPSFGTGPTDPVEAQTLVRTEGRL